MKDTEQQQYEQGHKWGQANHQDRLLVAPKSQTTAKSSGTPRGGAEGTIANQGVERTTEIDFSMAHAKEYWMGMVKWTQKWRLHMDYTWTKAIYLTKSKI